MVVFRKVIFCLWVVLLSQSVAAQAEVDPWEGFNRSMFAFNETLDKYLLLPLTKGYRAVTPDVVEKGVHNFFGNLGDFNSLFNNLFQLKLAGAAQDGARLAANTVLGLGGILDVATPLGLPKQDEDFGQALGYWGVKSGPYLVLPFFGPSTLRDGIGRIPDAYINSVIYFDDEGLRYFLLGLRTIDQRSQIMEAERLISGDRYTFIRDAYLQRREFLVNDGKVERIYEDDGF